MNTSQRTWWSLVVTVLALGFALRIAHIERQSIWYDEGLSIYYARADLGTLVRETSRSDHPPLHALMLHLWIRACGTSELSVRLLSAWWGLLAVALLCRLTKRMSPPIALVAALLLAVSPLAVYYAQEARGYTMAMALVIAAADAALDLFGTATPRARWRYLLYVLLATASLYTHFYSAFALLALNIAYVIVHAPAAVRTKAGRRAFGAWAIAQLAVLLLFAPWIPFVLQQLQNNATYWHGAVGWRQIVRRTIVAFSVGTTLADGWAVAATWSLSTMVALGTLALVRRRRWRRYIVVLWAWVLVPTLALVAINLTRAKFSPRYLMSALPPVLTLAAAGICYLGSAVQQHAFSWRGWTAAAALVVTVGILGGATTRSLANLYLDERLYRPDFRAVASYIDERASPDDLVVLVGGHSYPAFTYYYRGPAEILPLPDELLPTTREPIGLEDLATLNQAITGRQTLWLVLWQESLADPTGLVMDAIEQTYHRLGVGQDFHGLALLAFDVSPGPLLASGLSPQTPVVADLEGQVRFLGFDLPIDRARPGETLYLYLYWEAQPNVTRDYKVFSQVLDEHDVIVAQQDKVAGAASYPTSHWIPGRTVRDRFLLTIDPKAEPGRHRLIAGLYSPGGDHARLSVTGEGAQGDHLLLAEIVVLPE